MSSCRAFRRPVPASLASILALLFAGTWLGCNVLTGADELMVSEEVGEGGGAGWGGQSTTPAGVGIGGWGGSENGQGGTGNVGNTGATGATGGFGAGSSTGGSGGVGAGPTGCPWPSGAIGNTVGMTLPQGLTWQGYRDGSSAVETISVEDYFDCDGTRGINAVLFSSQSWNCGACQIEASELEGKMAVWLGQGIKVVVLLLRNVYEQPASTTEVFQWKNQWGLSSMAVVADPDMELLTPNSGGIPQNTVVDPRTMQVVHVESGYDGDIAELLSLAAANADL